ncbi:MAG: hypothetical protein O2854_08180 [Chloroflexi bacterium]|nr:hypothetical protein [Chloroflexota bacterium]
MVILLVVASVSAVEAGGAPEFQPIDAEALIKECWDLSEQKRASGVTAVMREGTLETVSCLEGLIAAQAAEMFAPDIVSGETASTMARDITSSVGKLYWHIYNDHVGCFPACGTMYYLFPSALVADVLEKIIRDMVAQRNDYHIPDRPL